MKTKEDSNSRTWIILLIILCIVLSIIGILVGLKINQYKNSRMIIINGDSMAPALKNGEKKLYNKGGTVERYDIIVYKKDNVMLAKRVYGLPGETLTIKNGKIYIEGKGIIEDKYATTSTEDYYSITLKDDEYFVLGDNRKISMDSRHTGPVKKESIKGKIYNK